MAKITAPFTPEQVVGLNNWQRSPVYHSFTCKNNHEHRDLIATRKGWVCPSCDYEQNWAHDFMVLSYPEQRAKIEI